VETWLIKVPYGDANFQNCCETPKVKLEKCQVILVWKERRRMGRVSRWWAVSSTRREDIDS
jgi:hypothetical protein